MHPQFSDVNEFSSSTRAPEDCQPYELFSENIDDGSENSTAIDQHLFGAPAGPETHQPTILPLNNQQHVPLSSASGVRRRGAERVHVGRHHPYFLRQRDRPATIGSTGFVVSSNGHAPDQDPSRIFDLDYSFDFDLLEAEQDWLS
jgi:hypothetical protein